MPRTTRSLWFRGMTVESVGEAAYNARPRNSTGGCSLHDDSSSQGKRAFRGGAAPLQAHGGEDGPAHRAALPRVLRKAHLGPQAQARRGREASAQAPTLADAPAQAVLIPNSSRTPDLSGGVTSRCPSRPESATT